MTKEQKGHHIRSGEGYKLLRIDAVSCSWAYKWEIKTWILSIFCVQHSLESPLKFCCYKWLMCLYDLSSCRLQTESRNTPKRNDVACRAIWLCAYLSCGYSNLNFPICHSSWSHDLGFWHSRMCVCLFRTWGCEAMMKKAVVALSQLFLTSF